MYVSRYIIHVPLSATGNHALIHGYTGAIDIVDNPVATRLKELACQETPDCEAFFPPDQIKTLQERGYLTPRNKQEEIDFVCQLSIKLHGVDQRTRSKFFILPSLNCQIRCTYCFERDIQNKGEKERWLGEIMSPEVVDAAFRAISDLQSEPARNPITLYGGEPFIPANLKIVPYILKRGHELGYRFVAITNAVNLEAYRAYLRPEMIEGLLVTIDGPRRTHDSARIYANGGGTFDRVVNNIQLALDQGLKVRIRINTSREVLESLPEFLEFYRSRGWEQNPNVVVYCQEVWQPQPKTLIAAEEIPIMTSSLGTTPGNGNGSAQSAQLKLADIITHLQSTELGEVIRAGEPILYQLEMLAKSNILAAMSPSHCGAHKGMYLFDPFGYIYTCTEHVGKADQSIGRFWPDFVWSSATKNKWHQRAVHNLPVCQQCKYVFLCGGGCAYHAEVEQGKMYVNQCDRFDDQFINLADVFLSGKVNQADGSQFLNACD